MQGPQMLTWRKRFRLWRQKRHLAGIVRELRRAEGTTRAVPERREVMKLTLRKILCPVDFSRGAAFATRYALKLAELHSSQLLLLQIAESRLPQVDGPSLPTLRRSLRES